ncbi:unnamed protein product [Callosobruchus maculatus]|uniref:Uncharacterized protein n=1 Tax=Callosobruchus maculatus TaxID=64391 RepID=A0A653CM30_CALMS|nr:unnamed protein product [Callosobruchus maculatus]
MFNLSKSIETPRSRLNERGDPPDGLIGSFMEPKITSTPLVRDNHPISPPKPRLFSPHRYSLSESVPSYNNKRNGSLHTRALGPLLASTKYNVNVSTYEDAKSPGLVSRIVQYNEETEQEKEHQRPATHQAKYSGAGLFPIVHLFKKDLPTLEPRKVTVKLASSDYSKTHSHEYNQKLLEGITKPGSPSLGRRTVIQGPNDNNSSTRSVLDALKEISRKRIHANEEFDLNEDDSKRIRTDQINAESNKRSRADSPLLDSSQESYSSSEKPHSKRICVYDEYAASCSSTNYLSKVPESSAGGAKRKSVSISTLTENPKDSKQVKLVTVETQTSDPYDAAKISESTSTTELDSKNEEEPDETKSSTKRESPVKIFDDAPLERIRRNRLMALMGSLAGKDASLTPKPDAAAVLVEKPKDVVDSDKDKSLVSIMSHNKSHPEKSDKHVHFNIPSSTDTSESAVSSFTTQTLQSNSVAKSQTPAPPSSPVNLPTSEPLTSTSLSTSKDLPVINFSAGGDSLKTTASIPTLQFNSASSTSLGLPAISTSVTSVSSSASVSFTSKSDSPKIGGFKFDLPKSISTTSVASSVMSTTSTSAAQLTFNTTTSKTDLTIPQPAFGGVGTTNSAFPASGGFVLGSKSSSSTTVLPSFGLKATTANSALPSLAAEVSSSPAAVAFGAKSSVTTPSCGVTQSSTSTTASPGFGTSITSATSTGQPTFNTTPTFNFGSGNKDPSNTTLTTFGAPTSTPAPPSYESTTQNKTFSFGSTNNTTTITSFGSDTKPIISFGGVQPNAQTNSAASFSFGAVTTTAGSFSTSTTTTSGAFGTTVASTDFGTTTAASTFSSPGMTRTTTGFGTGTTTTTTASVPIFGAAQTTTSSTFGSSTASAIPFSKPTLPTFGQTTAQSSFGAPTTSAPASFGNGNNTFGSTNTTNSGSMFGGSNPPLLTNAVFGTGNGTFRSQNQPQNIFGGAAAAQPSGFGVSSSANQTFGGATAPAFGNSVTTTTTNTAGFGTTGSAPVFSFGAKTTTSAPTFGTGNTFGATTTTASSGFGTTSSTSFGSTGGFGTANTTFGASSGNFGANPAPSFGAATTTQNTGFGTTNTPTFGASTGAFGGATSKPAFGSVAPSSSSATPAFGATAPTAAFGQPNPSSAAFGSNTASAFSKPSSSSFGTASSASGSFGSANSSFGAAQPPANAATFNSPTTTQSGVFSFGGGGSAPTAAKPAGVFSFGGGATGSSGDVAKPSYNFTAGAAPPSFGGAPSPSFGANNVAVPQFGATGTPQFGATATGGAPGTFNIGAGPPASNRGRTTLKPRRRI